MALPFGYTELHGVSGQETYTVMTGSGQKAKRVFRGPWTLRQDFIKSLLPGISEAGGEILFSDPGVYPDIPNLIAVTCTVEGRAASDCEGEDGMIRYEFAIVTVDYEYLIGNSGLPGIPIPAPFPQYLVITCDVSSQLFTIEKEENIQGADPNIPEADPFGPNLRPLKKVLPQIDINLKILFHPNPRITEAANLSGHINSVAFTFPKINLTCPVNSLLFHGMALIEKAYVGALTIFELDYKFTFKPGTAPQAGDGKFPNWNQNYNREGAIRPAIFLNNEDTFPSADFLTLFADAP